jgi:hypothetical protein
MSQELNPVTASHPRPLSFSSTNAQISSVSEGLMDKKRRSSSVGKLPVKKNSRTVRRLTESGAARKGVPEDEVEVKGIVGGFLLPSTTEFRISAYETGIYLL